MHSNRLGELIVQGGPNFRALRHANERTGILKRTSWLSERKHQKRECRRQLHGKRVILTNCGNPVARDSELGRNRVVREGDSRVVELKNHRLQTLAVHIMTNTALTGATYDIDGGQQFVAA